jgi:hypothetical protein
MAVDWDHRQNISPLAPSEYLSGLRLRSFDSVALSAEAIDFIKHSLKQGLRGSRWNAGLLELLHFLPLAPNLDAHAFDFGPDKVEVRHISPWKITIAA